MAKKWELTPERLEKIRDMAHKGCTEDNIARCVGISPGCWYEKKKIHPEIDDIIKNAKASGEEELVGILWSHIRDKNVSTKEKLPTIFFMLKTRHRWRETEPAATVTDKDKVEGLNFLEATKDES